MKISEFISKLKSYNPSSGYAKTMYQAADILQKLLIRHGSTLSKNIELQTQVNELEIGLLRIHQYSLPDPFDERDIDLQALKELINVEYEKLGLSL